MGVYIIILYVYIIRHICMLVWKYVYANIANTLNNKGMQGTWCKRFIIHS